MSRLFFSTNNPAVLQGANNNNNKAPAGILKTL